MNLLQSKSLVGVAIGIIGFIGSASVTLAYDSGESCYELNKRYGRCVQASMRGERCRPEDDIVMPERCRGGTDSDVGLRDGLFGAEPRGREYTAPAPASPDPYFELGRMEYRCATGDEAACARARSIRGY